MEEDSVKKIVGVITARMTSTRLPGKVMRKICGKSVFALHVERMRDVSGISDIYLATSKDHTNEPLIEESKKLKVKYYRGSEEDILERHTSILNKENADAALRITCDMPLFDISSLNRFVEIFKTEYYDYLYVANMTMVQGTIGELISRKAMIRAGKSYRGPAITQPIRENMKEYKTLCINIPQELCRPEYRLTLDYHKDFKVISFIYKNLYKGRPISLYDVYNLLDDNPYVTRLNRDMRVKEVNIYGSTLVDMPEYSIVKSGSKYLILNKNKSSITLEEFLKELEVMFPHLHKSNL